MAFRVRPNGWAAMLRIVAKQIALRLLTPKQRPPYEEVWHLWTVRVPRRSLTGRLLWGTVLRRQHDGRWIYKKYIEIVHGTEFVGSAKILIGDRTDVLVSERTQVLADERTEIPVDERTEALVGEREQKAPPPLPSLRRAQTVAALAILSVLIMLSVGIIIEQRHPQIALPTANCENDGTCSVLGTTTPMPNSHKSQPEIKNAVAVAPDQFRGRDANGNQNGVIISSKTGARARVGVRYAERFQAYIDDLENNRGARVLFMGGTRPGHCSTSSQHPCGKALDVCQLRRGVVDPRCHLPGPGALAEIAASHGLFEGGRWCNSDYGHAQVDVTAAACGKRRVQTVRHPRTPPAAWAQIAPPR